MGLTREQAIALDIRAWEWRRDNPDKGDYEMPDELYASIRDLDELDTMDCSALCCTCRDYNGECHECPFVKCDKNALPSKWLDAQFYGDKGLMSEYAKQIVDVLKKAI